MKIMAIVNQKGGVGKTTTTLNLSAGLVRLGARVLIIDLDPQAHLTFSIGVRTMELLKNISDVMLGETSISDVILIRGKISIIPSARDLQRVQTDFINTPQNHTILKEAITAAKKRLSDIDMILIDTPPSLDALTINAMTAAHEIFIPVSTEMLPYHALDWLMDTIEDVQRKINPSLEVGGMIGTRFDPNNPIHQEIRRHLEERFGDLFFKTVIREDVKISQSPEFAQSVIEYAPDSPGAMDYMNLCREIIER